MDEKYLKIIHAAGFQIVQEKVDTSGGERHFVVLTKTEAAQHELTKPRAAYYELTRSLLQATPRIVRPN